MSAVTARVQHGRLTLDAPSDLPEGALVELVPLDGWDDLDDDDRADLHEALRASRAELEAGDVLATSEVIAGLRALARSA